MNIVDQKITTENKKNTKTTSDTLENHSYSILKIEFDNKLLIFKEEILNLILTLKEDIAKLSIKVSVLSTQVDMIKFVGSIAIGVIITGFGFLYARIDKVETKLEAKIDKIEAKIDKVEAKLEARINKVEDKLDKLYDLMVHKK